MPSKFTGLRPITKAVLAAAAVSLAGVSTPGMAGAKLEIDENTFFTVGGGIRTSVRSVESAAPNGKDDSSDFDVENIRLYFGGQVNDLIKFTLNTEEIYGDGPVDVLDAIAQFEFSPKFNVWVGRMLTPADRIEMNGPFYAMSWNQYTQPLYPSDQGGDAGTYGRDDGVTAWGTLGKFQYAMGVFNGVDGYSNQEDNVLFAGRFAYNFLNMEANPSYYTSSTYFGKAGNILTLGVSFQSQDGGSGSAEESGDFSGYTIDLLSETAFDSGAALTLEAEYKDFDADYTLATPPGSGDCFCLFSGDSYYVTGGFLFPGMVGPGQFQPYVRLVQNNPDDGKKSDLTEFGVNYVIDGFNALVNFNYGTGDANISGYAGSDVDSISIGVQLQI